MAVDGFGAFVAQTDEPTRRGLFDLHRRLKSAQAEIDALQASVALLSEMETDTYTPSLTGMAIGTGGSAQNTARYVFVGGQEVGDHGLLSISGVVTFGTSGTTFPTDPQIGLPPAFNHVGESTIRDTLGMGFWNDATDSTVRRYAPIHRKSATAVGLYIQGYTAITAAISTTTPFTWAAGDSINWNVHGCLVVRV